MGGKIAVRSGGIVTGGSIIAGSIPYGYVATKVPTGVMGGGVG